MIRTNVHFPEKLLKQLKALSKRTGVPVAEILRRAAVEYLAKQGA
jgi:predicted DNA-binding protein